MTDTHLNLFCLVNGESTPFPVEIESTKTIGGLKNLLGRRCQRPHPLEALWKPSIPVVPKKERKEISLADVPLKEELDETDDVSDVFKEQPPKKTIHIIVQRPLQVTPIPTIFIPQSNIEAELADILEGVSHNHTINIINLQEVEASQKE
ncbi:hypothetical protein BGZ80_006282, partial [Entomortierella chlamydospora]